MFFFFPSFYTVFYKVNITVSVRIDAKDDVLKAILKFHLRIGNFFFFFAIFAIRTNATSSIDRAVKFVAYFILVHRA